MACGILAEKLRELDGRLERLHSGIEQCGRADPEWARTQAEQLRAACDRQEAALHTRLSGSRSCAVAQLAQSYDRIEREIACVQRAAERLTGEQAAEGRLLLAEYALDFAAQAADRALLAALEARCAQQEE